MNNKKQEKQNMKKADKVNHHKKLLIILLFLGGILVTKSTTSAAKDNNWLDIYEEMRCEMEEETTDLLQKEISSKSKEEVDKDNWWTTLVSYDIKNAIPVWKIEYDFQMIADYKKYDKDFSKLVTWNNMWCIPAKTMDNADVTIIIYKEGQQYKRSGIYLDEDNIYVAESMETIKSIVKQNFEDNVSDVKTIYLPFYDMNLLYIKDVDGKEYIMPYESRLTTVIEVIGGESGQVYELSDFIQEMDNHFEEYTEKELKTIASQGLLGGRPELKLKTPPTEKNNHLFLISSLIIVSILLIVAAVIMIVKRTRKQGGIR